MINNQNGMMFRGAAPNNAPFFGGFLCVSAPLVLTPVQNGGGNPGAAECSGSYDSPWSTNYIQQSGLGAGSRIFAQFWSRDPASSFGISLSAGIDFTLRL
ncbi:MAG: hypothetical protein ACI835_004146 [Planctomycetota bacterium]